MTMFCDGMLLGVGGLAPPVFISSTTGDANSATTTITINKPASVAVGDDLTAIIWGYTNITAVMLAGWTVVGSDFTNNNRVAILRRKVDGSEGASFTFGTTGGVAKKVGSILCHRGGAGLVDVVGTYNFNSFSTISTMNSLTATKPGVLVATFHNAADAVSVGSAPSGMTQRALINTQTSMAVYELATSPVGATGAKTLTWSGSSTNVAGIGLQIY